MAKTVDILTTVIAQKIDPLFDTTNQLDEEDDANVDVTKRARFYGSRGKRVRYFGSRGKKSEDKSEDKRLSYYGSRGKKNLGFFGSRG